LASVRRREQPHYEVRDIRCGHYRCWTADRLLRWCTPAVANRAWYPVGARAGAGLVGSHTSSVEGRLSLAMRFRCLDCNQPIEGDPWWYDPLAHGINKWSTEVTQRSGVVSQRPGPPTGVSAPFHKKCLERQLGWSVDSWPPNGQDQESENSQSESIGMTNRCLDCNLAIEGEPWWYDPLAVGIQLGVAVATVNGVVTKRPYAPTSVAGPFHKDCLIRQMGWSNGSPKATQPQWTSKAALPCRVARDVSVPKMLHGSIRSVDPRGLFACAVWNHSLFRKRTHTPLTFTPLARKSFQPQL